MKNKSASVAKVALAVVPLSLMVVVARMGQQRRAEAATKRLLISVLKPNNPDYALEPRELEELAAQGADVNVNVYGEPFYGPGNTALHQAAYNPQYRDRDNARELTNARVLLDHGANSDVLNDAGETPLTIAVQARDVEIVRLLLRKGANVHLPLGGVRNPQVYWQTEAKTPLYLAQRSFIGIPDPQKEEIIQMLKAAGAKEYAGKYLHLSARCKFHGGASTGPYSKKGREAIAASNRARAQARAEATST